MKVVGCGCELVGLCSIYGISQVFLLTFLQYLVSCRIFSEAYNSIFESS